MASAVSQVFLKWTLRLLNLLICMILWGFLGQVNIENHFQRSPLATFGKSSTYLTFKKIQIKKTLSKEGHQFTSTKFCSPGWGGSVDWVPACKPKGHRFDSQSGHIPGLWARSLVGGAQETTTHWYFSPSLSLSLKNKDLKKKPLHAYFTKTLPLSFIKNIH